MASTPITPSTPSTYSRPSSPKHPSVDKLIWTPAMEQALLEGLVKQTQIGKQAESGYKKEAWTAVIKEIQAVMPVHKAHSITQQQAKNKMHIWKRRYTIWVELGNLSGFGWNDELGLYTASEETWDTYCAVSIYTDSSIIY